MKKITEEYIKQLDSVPVKDAAIFLGASQGYIREGIKSNRLPIGSAVQIGKGKWTFNISPGLLIEYKTGKLALKNYFEENKEILRAILED